MQRRPPARGSSYHDYFMSVLARFGRRKAFLRQGEWRSADPELEALLNRTTRRWIEETGGPALDDEDHEATTAAYVVALLGGQIVRRVPPPKQATARFYIRLRQLHFEFWES